MGWQGRRDFGGYPILPYGGRAVKRAVKAPLRNGAEALVEDGLKPGERVVVYPSDALRDGSRIQPR